MLFSEICLFVFVGLKGTPTKYMSYSAIDGVNWTEDKRRVERMMVRMKTVGPFKSPFTESVDQSCPHSRRQVQQVFMNCSSPILTLGTTTGVFLLLLVFIWCFSFGGGQVGGLLFFLKTLCTPNAVLLLFLRKQFQERNKLSSPHIWVNISGIYNIAGPSRFSSWILHTVANIKWWTLNFCHYTSICM